MHLNVFMGQVLIVKSLFLKMKRKRVKKDNFNLCVIFVNYGRVETLLVIQIILWVMEFL